MKVEVLLFKFCLTRLSKWHQLNSLVVERQETHLNSTTPENEEIKHQKVNSSQSLVTYRTLPSNSALSFAQRQKPQTSNPRAVHRSG